MKILWITEFFPKSDKGEITGGVEARCFFVKKYLSQLRHEIIIVAEKTTGNRWTHLSFWSLGKQFRFLCKVLLEAARYLFSEFDLVEGTNYPTYFIAWFLGTIKRKPIVFWYPDVFVGQWIEKIGLIGIVGEISERIVLKLPVNSYIAISNVTRDKLIRYGIDSRKIKVVYCGVDQDKIKKIPKLIKKYDICVVSRLVRYKCVIGAIEALAIVIKTHPWVKMAVVGQGAEMVNLKKRIAELGLKANVTMMGYIPVYENVLQVIAQSKIFCFPTSTEGFGIVAIEAAALGVPLVISNISVLDEITRKGQGSLIFKLNDSRDLAFNIMKLLDDNKLYKKKSLEALELARNYSWKDVAKETEKIYENLFSH